MDDDSNDDELSIFTLNDRSSRGGLEVELWTDNSLPSASVDQIPLEAMYLYGAIWTRFVILTTSNLGR